MPETVVSMGNWIKRPQYKTRKSSKHGKLKTILIKSLQSSILVCTQDLIREIFLIQNLDSTHLSIKPETRHTVKEIATGSWEPVRLDIRVRSGLEPNRNRWYRSWYFIGRIRKYPVQFGTGTGSLTLTMNRNRTGFWPPLISKSYVSRTIFLKHIRFIWFKVKTRNHVPIINDVLYIFTFFFGSKPIMYMVLWFCKVIEIIV